jgi:excisionase family DNA binding protein
MSRHDYYSVKEAADKICCSTSYVLKLIKRGELPEYKVGNRHFIPIRDIDAYVKKNTKEIARVEE